MIENLVWNVIHIFARTYKGQYNVDYLNAFINSTFRLLPINENTNKAFLWLCNSPLNKYTPNIWDWSCHFHYYINNNVSKIYLDALYHPKKLTKTVWGPIVWKFIHYMALLTDSKNKGYSKIEKQRFKDAFKCIVSSLQYILPCEMCKQHIRDNLSHIHIDSLKYKNNYFLWSYELHNYVNRFLKKKEISYEYAKSLYKL